MGLLAIELANEKVLCFVKISRVGLQTFANGLCNVFVIFFTCTYFREFNVN